MTNARQKRQMQEALDETLSLDARQRLHQELDAQPEDAELYSRLKQVDRLLRSAPMERAPERLALRIMARLAEGLQAQPLSQTAGMALALALALMALLLLPLMAAIGWMVLNTLGSASAMSQLLQNLANLLITLMRGLETMLQSVRGVVEASPQTPALLLALIPLAGIWLARYMGNSDERSSSDEA
jgi:antitoxin component HigA of HigAB toxin-antitoxin module